MPDLVTLYREHARFVWGVLHRLGVRDEELDDMLQEVFLVVHRRLPEFDAARASLRTWLFHVCRGVASSYRRGRVTRRVEDASDGGHEVCADAPSPEEAAARAEAKRRLELILSNMSVEKRETFLLYEVDRLSTEEIAGALGVERGTVVSRLQAARREFERGVRRFQLLDDVREKSP